MQSLSRPLATLNALLVNRIDNQQEVGESKEEQVLSYIGACEKIEVKVKCVEQIEDSKKVRSEEIEVIPNVNTIRHNKWRSTMLIFTFRMMH